MITFLSSIFIKNPKDYQSPAVRQAYGVLCGGVGIALNLVLFLGKWIAGMISGSIAITADAFNNLSDAGSSIITLVGFKLSGQKPDPEHPFGHGRMEYISGLFVSVAILIMGFELITTSIEKVRQPEPIESSPLILGILAASILIKVYMAYYNRSVGKKIGSAAMNATAMDSLSDTISTALVLAATIISHFTGLLLDGWFGILVGLFIFYTGIQTMKDTMNPLLGQPPKKELVKKIEQIVTAHSTVHGIHDLIVHDYGPGRLMISLHAEVDADGNLLELHDEIDNIEHELQQKLNCAATIHMDPIVTDDAEVVQVREIVDKIVASLGEDFTMHDFRMVKGPTHTNLVFDVVMPFHCAYTEVEVVKTIKQEIQEKIGRKYFAVIQIDRDFS
ncbi:MAG TPA: cation diffusion facilitator family transporter [Candidatus Blautia faecavium]|uniref:Cation diffusion facilitator family transporter n=1 Tax=Candidatus Blautia faecavium TaxID=2838487 RepID=A0A9D2LSE8_9FIRM|nr:cation diffusion facilitator family transporter [Candidatus Blautia faecavium]